MDFDSLEDQNLEGVGKSILLALLKRQESMSCPLCIAAALLDFTKGNDE